MRKPPLIVQLDLDQEPKRDAPQNLQDESSDETLTSEDGRLDEVTLIAVSPPPQS